MRVPNLVCVVLLASACMGQSGSEVMKPPSPTPTPTDPMPGPGPVPPGLPPRMHCPCGALSDMQQIRATITRVEDFPQVGQQRFSLRADAILSEAEQPEYALRAGDEFGGYYGGQLACSGDSGEQLAVGDEVVAFYRRGRQDGALCCELIDCTDTCRPVEGDDSDEQQRKRDACEMACETQTADACGAHRDEARMRGELMLIPWGNELLVGQNEYGSATITPDDLPLIAGDRDACEAGLEDRSQLLAPPPEPPSDAQDEEEDAPPPSQPGEMPPPATPPTPPASATPPTPGPSGGAPVSPMNTSNEAVGPPPAHPEEIRVRCAE